MYTILHGNIYPILHSMLDYTDDAVKTLLQNGEMWPISSGIKLMDSGGYQLREIVAALRNVYGLTETEAS